MWVTSVKYGADACLALPGNIRTEPKLQEHQLRSAMLIAAGATPEVFDSDDSPLAELYADPPAAEADEDSSANDTVVNSAGMQSMTSNVTAGDADAICKNNAFLLPLQLGQNSFSVAITAPDPPEQASMRKRLPRTKHAKCAYACSKFTYAISPGLPAGMFAYTQDDVCCARWAVTVVVSV